MSNLPEETTKITIFLNNGEIHHGDVYVGSGWVSSVESFWRYIGDNKYFKDENGFFYPLTTISKMKDMTTSELKQYLRDNKINNILDK